MKTQWNLNENSMNGLGMFSSILASIHFIVINRIQSSWLQSCNGKVHLIFLFGYWSVDVKLHNHWLCKIRSTTSLAHRPFTQQGQVQPYNTIYYHTIRKSIAGTKCSDTRNIIPQMVPQICHDSCVVDEEQLHLPTVCHLTIGGLN